MHSDALQFATTSVIKYILSRFDLEEKKKEGPYTFAESNLKNFIRIHMFTHTGDRLIKMSYPWLMQATGLNKIQLIKVFEHLKEKEIVSTMDLQPLTRLETAATQGKPIFVVGADEDYYLQIEANEKRLAHYLQKLTEEGVSEGTIVNGMRSFEPKKQEQDQDTHIKSFICVKPNDKSQNTYKLVLNEDYTKPLTADRAKPSWDLIFKVANEESIRSDNHKASLDYLNVNPSCKIYSKTGYSVTKILKSEDGYIVPVVPIAMITEKAYRQRLKKGRNPA